MKYIGQGTAVAAVMQALALAAAGPAVGWRTDGVGRYPDARPVSEWSATKNVLWAAPMPNWGNASPVLVGDRLIVCAEPDEVICVNKADGAVLWRRRVQLSDIWTDEDRAVAAENQKKSDALKKEYQRLDDEINETWEARQKDPKDQALRDKYKALGQAQAKVLSDISKLNRWAPAKTEPTNGYTSSTPVSDGRHVWVLMGTGVAACFDLNGERRWVKYIERPKHQEGHAASPVLHAGRLLLHIQTLRAYEPLTGEMLWECPALPRSWGTPFPTTVGGTPVVVTARGKIVRMSDGHIMGGLGTSLEYCSPLVADGVAYFIQAGGEAARLSLTTPDTVDAQRLWITEPKKDRYYTSPVLDNGLIYTMHQKGLFSVIDAKTGAVIKSETLDLGKGDAYTSVSLAGGRLFVGSESGRMAVIQPGRDFKVLAVNTLDKFRSTPVFEGGRMYLRTSKFLYCIGRS